MSRAGASLTCGMRQATALEHCIYDCRVPLGTPLGCMQKGIIRHYDTNTSDQRVLDKLRRRYWVSDTLVSWSLPLWGSPAVLLDLQPSQLALCISEARDLLANSRQSEQSYCLVTARRVSWFCDSFSIWGFLLPLGVWVGSENVSIVLPTIAGWFVLLVFDGVLCVFLCSRKAAKGNEKCAGCYTWDNSDVFIMCIVVVLQVSFIWASWMSPSDLWENVFWWKVHSTTLLRLNL